VHDAHEFLKALATVLCVAALTTVVFQRLHQPVVLGYIIAGLLIGPHVPVPLVADADIVRTLSEIGVIMLMFSLGGEFSIRRLVELGPTAGFIGLIQCSLMLWLGYVVGRALGWTELESLFTGAIVAISSTTIIAKAFDEQGVRGKLRDLVVGILIVEDLVAIFLMAALTAVSSGQGMTADALAMTVGKLVAFLVGLLVVGLLVVPRAVRSVVRLGRAETTLVASIGICFAIALLAQTAGYSVALGAFVAGALVAESGHAWEIEQLVMPVRDMFAAIFFVSVGMLIAPALVLEHWGAIVALIGLVIVGKIVSVALGAFLTGYGTRIALQAGMSLAQIGEFSFIIASLGLALGVTGQFLYPVAVGVSAATTLTTPWLIRASGPLANFVDRKLPKPLQTFASLYGSWLEVLRAAPREVSARARSRRLVRLLVLDAAILTAIVLATSLWSERVTAFVRERTDIPARLVLLGLGLVAVLASLPFAAGLVRCARALGTTLANRALPSPVPGKLDMAAAARRVLVVVLQLLIALLVGMPVLAILQPFIPGWASALAVVAFAALFAISFWRSATNLQGHVRAGAEVVVEALAKQTRAKKAVDDHTLDDMQKILPGLGTPTPVRLEPRGYAVGKTLAQLNLRGLTGATVLALMRGDRGVVAPDASEVLEGGDVVALVGTHEAIEAARSLLGGGGEPAAADEPRPAGRAEGEPPPAA
jgi:CPA2 family monovalent cation:H+ antiporter-2